MSPQHVVERGIEQRLEMAADGLFEVPGVEQWGQLRRQRQLHRGAAGFDQPRRRHPLPRSAVAGCEMPPRRDMGRPASGFGDDFP
jgi:hypothetical protein